MTMVEKTGVFVLDNIEDFIQKCKDVKATEVYFKIQNKEEPVKLENKEKPEEPIAGNYLLSEIALTSNSPDLKYNIAYTEVLYAGVSTKPEDVEEAKRIIVARVEAIKSEFQRFYGGATLKAGRCGVV